MNRGTRGTSHFSLSTKTHQSGYSDWRQVAGYYDGDGGEEIKIGKFMIRFSVTWTDTYLPQLRHIGSFLVGEGLAPSTLRLGTSSIGREAWHLTMWEEGGMLETCRRMLPFLDKKKTQVNTLLDYMENRITANDALQTFNQERAEGKWAGKLRSLDIPWTRSEGRRLGRYVRGNALPRSRR